MTEHLPTAVQLASDAGIGSEGFYRLSRDTSGRWWLVSPENTPIVYKGCCAICDGIPGKAYTTAYYRKYGNDHRRFVADSTAILRDLGFNAYGMWSYLRTPDAGYDQTGMGYIEYINAREVRPESNVRGDGVGAVDPWDPAWQEAYDTRAAGLCLRHRDNPHLVGYYADNEPFWGQVWHQVERGQEDLDQDQLEGRTWLGVRQREHRWGIDGMEDSKGGSLLQRFLILEPSRPGRRVAWDFVLERYDGSLDRLAAAWGLDLSSPEDLARHCASGLKVNTEAFGEDHVAFTRHFMRQFYRITGEAFRRHDPHHLRLGVRHCASPSAHGGAILGGYDDPEIRAHVDVCSVNIYQDWPAEVLAEYARHMDCPIIVGEYSWGGWIYDGQTYPPEWQDDKQGWLTHEGVRRTAEFHAHPQCIGYTWFKWYCDNYDAAAPAYAVVTEAHEVNRFNAPMFRHLHAALEDVHAARREPTDVAAAMTTLTKGCEHA